MKWNLAANTSFFLISLIHWFEYFPKGGLTEIFTLFSNVLNT